MWIHLLRHGIAIDREDPACPADPERYLTDKGKRRTQAAARGIAALGICPEVVLVSPYVRAQQTAELAVSVFGPDAPPTRTVDALVPEGEPAAVARAIAAIDVDSVMCVGHAPNLDVFAAYLVGSDIEVTRLKKAGLASLECHGVGFGEGTLFAIYPPSILRRVGGTEG